MNTESELRSLASGIRAVGLVFTLILCYFNLRLAFQISHFQAIFSDMLGGKLLPGLTQIVISGRPALILLALLLPVLAVAVVVVVRSHKTALYALSGVMLWAFVQMHFTWTALFAPLMGIVNGMRGDL